MVSFFKEKICLQKPADIPKMKLQLVVWSSFRKKTNKNVVSSAFIFSYHTTFLSQANILEIFRECVYQPKMLKPVVMWFHVMNFYLIKMVCELFRLFDSYNSWKMLRNISKWSWKVSSLREWTENFLF